MIQDNNELILHTFETQKNLSLLIKYLKSISIDVSRIKSIAVTGGKSSDLENNINRIPVIKLNEIDAIGSCVRNFMKLIVLNF